MSGAIGSQSFVALFRWITFSMDRSGEIAGGGRLGTNSKQDYYSILSTLAIRFARVGFSLAADPVRGVGSSGRECGHCLTRIAGQLAKGMISMLIVGA
jgi:hypothetical protein